MAYFLKHSSASSKTLQFYQGLLQLSLSLYLSMDSPSPCVRLPGGMQQTVLTLCLPQEDVFLHINAFCLFALPEGQCQRPPSMGPLSSFSVFIGASQCCQAPEGPGNYLFWHTGTEHIHMRCITIEHITVAKQCCGQHGAQSTDRQKLQTLF
jgi:hypothetical protein